MKLIRTAVLGVPLALLAACSGSAGTSANPTFSNAAPSYSALAMDQTAADASPLPVALTASPVENTSQALLAPLGPSDCHPHLFVRTHEVVERVNRHLYKFLRHAEQLMSRDP